MPQRLLGIEGLEGFKTLGFAASEFEGLGFGA